MKSFSVTSQVQGVTMPPLLSTVKMESLVLECGQGQELRAWPSVGYQLACTEVTGVTS